jgi:tRNA(Ile)-lysidine synthase
MVRQLESPREDFACAIRHDGRMLRRYRDLVAIERADRPQPAADRASQADLPSGFGGIEIRWRGERRLEFPALNGNLLIEPVLTPGQAGLRAELLRSADLGLKPRCGGERLRTRSGGPHRSLKNLFQEQGVPAWQRAALPVLWAGGRPVWVPRLGFDAECASDSGERYALRWEARHDDDD